MGRKKIKIEPIQEGRNRQVTYLKRKAGLFKKAHELATLTDSSVAVIVFGHNGRLSQFCSGDIDQVLLRYTEFEGNIESKGPRDFAGGRDDDEDDEEDDKPNDHKFRGGPGGGRGGGPGGTGGGGASGSSGGFQGGSGDSGPSSSTDTGQGSSGSSGTRFSGPSRPSGSQLYTSTSRGASNSKHDICEDEDGEGETDTSSSPSTSPSEASSSKRSLRAAVLGKGKQPLTATSTATATATATAKRKAPPPRTAAKGKGPVKGEDDENEGLVLKTRTQLPMARSMRKPRPDASVLMPMPRQPQQQPQPRPLPRPRGSMPSVLAPPNTTRNAPSAALMSHSQSMSGFIGAGPPPNDVRVAQSAPGSYSNTPCASGSSTPVGPPWLSAAPGPGPGASASAGMHFPMPGPSQARARVNSMSQPPEGISAMPFAARPNTAGVVMDRGNDWQRAQGANQDHAAICRPVQPHGGMFSVDSGMSAMGHHHHGGPNVVEQHAMRYESPLPAQPQQQQGYAAPFAPETTFTGNDMMMSAFPSAPSRCGSVSSASASLSMSRPGTDDYNSGAPPSACDTPLLGSLGSGSFGGPTGAGGKSMVVGSAVDAALQEWVASTLLPGPVAGSEEVGASDGGTGTTMVKGLSPPLLKMGPFCGPGETPALARPRTVASQLLQAGLHTFTPRLSEDTVGGSGGVEE